MDFKQFLKVYGYTNKTFADQYNVKLRTVENWSFRGCPDFVLQLLVEVEELRKEIVKLRNDYMKLYNYMFGGAEDDKEEH